MRFGAGLGRLLERRQLAGEGVQEDVGQLLGMLAQHPQLCVHIRLRLAVVGHLRALEQGAFEVDGSQLQRSAQDFIGDLERTFQQLTYAGRRRRSRDPSH
ncbi:hypothetical protein D3C81_1813300 [compost metagenome]